MHDITIMGCSEQTVGPSELCCSWILFKNWSILELQGRGRNNVIHVYYKYMYIFSLMVFIYYAIICAIIRIYSPKYWIYYNPTGIVFYTITLSGGVHKGWKK